MHVQHQLRLAYVLALVAAAIRPGFALDPQSSASSYRRTTFTTEDGLAANVINDILQTRDGSLWIATYNGLTRFDGKHSLMCLSPNCSSTSTLLAVPTKRGPTRTVDYLEGDEIGAMLEAVSAHRQDHIRDGAMLLT
jgi:ligand-binding sensor domain-containing protein